MIFLYWFTISIIVLFLLLYLLSNYTKILSKFHFSRFLCSNVTKYILRRILLSIFSVFAIISIVFLLLRFISDNEELYSNNVLIDLLHYYKSILPYPKKVCSISTLEESSIVCSKYEVKIIDLGSSMFFMKNIRVWDIIKQKCSVSLLIGLIAYVLECAIGYPLGIFLARKNNKHLNNGFNILYTLISSIPLALIFYIFLLVFMVIFHLPTSFDINNALSYLPPIISVTFTSVLVISHWVHMYIQKEAKKDYVLFAYSKGLNEKDVFYKHIMKNSLIPLIRSIPTSIVACICGSYLLETTFGIPGAGSTLISAIRLNDIILIRGLILFFSFISIVSYFIGDIISLILDPRVKFKEGDRHE